MMSAALALYTIPLLISSVMALFIFVYTWQRRQVRGASPLGLIGLAMAIWSAGYALEIGAPAAAQREFWAKIEYLGIAFVPYFWLLFAADYTRPAGGWAQRALNWAAVLPALTAILALTNEQHNLIWQAVSVETFGGIELLVVVERGAWFWVHFALSYLFLLAGSGLILAALARRRGIYRAQSGALIIAVLAPWLANGLYLGGLSPFPGLDLTPFAFTITLLSLSWAIFGYRLVALAPIARGQIIEEMQDGMMVFNRQGQLVDINPAAVRIIGLTPDLALGRNASEIFAPWPEFARRVYEGERATVPTLDELHIGQAAARQSYQVRITYLHSPTGEKVGQLLTLREMQSPSAQPFTASSPAPVADVTLEEPQPVETLAASDGLGQQLWRQLVNFMRVPIKHDLLIPTGSNRDWMQTLERAFTAMIRIAALLGTIALAMVIPSYIEEGLYSFVLIMLSPMLLLWLLGLARQIDFRLRAILFASIAYALALFEIYNYGFSVESFTYLMTFVVLATLLTQLRGGLLALAASIVTLVLGSWLVGEGILLPFVSINNGTVYFPPSFISGLISSVAFAANAVAVVFAINILIGSLDSAWRKETQALNLLQIERNLLEQRVQERTQDLEQTRDLALLQSNELRKYFQALEQSGNVIIITDPAGRIEYVNPKFEQVTGYTKNEAIGQNPRILKSGQQDTAFYAQMWQTIGAGKTWRGELHNQRKDGSLFWESATITPVMDASGKVITHYISIKEDITEAKQLQDRLLLEIEERKRTEGLLVNSEARFRQLVENASDMIYRTDVLGRFVYINPPAMRLMGFEHEEQVLGRYYWELAHPDWRDQVKRFYARQFLRKTDNSYLEFVAQTHDKGTIWIGQNVQTIKDGEQIIGFQAVARNITNLKEIQEALALARDQAMEASRFKGQLLARVSHELRTPLGGVMGYAELLGREMFGPLNTAQAEAAQSILASATYLSSVINDLLDQAQIDARSLRLSRSPFAPAELLSKSTASLKVLAAAKKLIFHTEIDAKLPPMLMGDAQRLQQIIINLGSNAIKFTTRGEVGVGFAMLGGRSWHIRVWDTGAGIPKEAQSLIFEPFRQVDNAITHSNRGTGLGLSITQQLVEMMGGQIEVQSDVGQGSVFTVILPLETPTETKT